MPYDACKACIAPSLLPLQRGAAVAAAAFSVVLSACSNIPRPTEQVDAARAAVAQAQPAAGLDGAAELQTARGKLAGAEHAMQLGHYIDARILAEQAEVDARYASALGENARQERAAAEVEQNVRVLRQELDRRLK